MRGAAALGFALLAFALAAAVPAPASAVAQALDPADSRIATLPYRAGEVVPLRSAAGNSLSIIFAPGERVTDVEVSDLDAFDVSLSGAADSVVLKALRAPASPSVTVRTNLRSYAFAISLGPANEAMYLVRFAYAPELPAAGAGPAGAGAAVGAEAPASRYALSGTRELRPARISDDGVHTYLEWDEDQVLPAVFAINSVGEEEMVDGYMRDGVFTIDRVHTRLMFRFGKKWASARRSPRRD